MSLLLVDYGLGSLQEEGSRGRRRLVLRRGTGTGSSVALSEQTTTGGVALLKHASRVTYRAWLEKASVTLLGCH